MNVIDLNKGGKDQLAQDWLNFARFEAIPGYRKGVEQDKQYKVASFKYEPFELKNYTSYEEEIIHEKGRTEGLTKRRFWRPHDSILRVPQKDGFLELFYTQKLYVWQWLFRLPAYHVNQTGGILTDKRVIQTGVHPIGNDWFQGNKSSLDILLEQEILFFTIMSFADQIFPVGTVL